MKTDFNEVLKYLTMTSEGWGSVKTQFEVDDGEYKVTIILEKYDENE